MSGPKHLWSGDWERESADAARNRPGPPAPPPETGWDEPVVASSDRRRRVRLLAIGALTAIVVVAGGIVLANVLGGSPRHRPRPIASVPNPAAGNTGSPQSNPNGGTGLSQAPGTQTTPTVTVPPQSSPNGGVQTAPTPSQPGQGGSQTTPNPSQPGGGGSQTTPGGSQLGPGGNQAGPGGSVKPTPQAAPPTFTNQPTVHWLGMQIITSPTGAVVNTVQIGSEGDTAGFEPGDVIAAVAGSQIDSARAIRAAVAHVPLGGHVAVEIARGSTLITMAVTMQGRPTLQP